MVYNNYYINFSGFYIFIFGLACLATLKDCWQSWTDVADTKEQHEDVAEYKETTSKQKDGIVSGF